MTVIVGGRDSSGIAALGPRLLLQRYHCIVLSLILLAVGQLICTCCLSASTCNSFAGQALALLPCSACRTWQWWPTLTGHDTPAQCGTDPSAKMQAEDFKWLARANRDGQHSISRAVLA